MGSKKAENQKGDEIGKCQGMMGSAVRRYYEVEGPKVLQFKCVGSLLKEIVREGSPSRGRNFINAVAEGTKSVEEMEG